MSFESFDINEFSFERYVNRGSLTTNISEFPYVCPRFKDGGGGASFGYNWTFPRISSDNGRGNNGCQRKGSPQKTKMFPMKIIQPLRLVQTEIRSNVQPFRR